MQVHTITPGEIVFNKAREMINSYEALYGKSPICIEMTKEEVRAIKFFLRKSLSYPTTVEDSTILGIPIYVN